MLMPDQSSSSRHSSLDLELDSILKWVSWVVKWSSVEIETLVGTVVAHPPDKLILVSVSVSSNIKAVVSLGSNVSSNSWIETNL